MAGVTIYPSNELSAVGGESLRAVIIRGHPVRASENPSIEARTVAYAKTDQYWCSSHGPAKSATTEPSARNGPNGMRILRPSLP